MRRIVFSEIFDLDYHTYRINKIFHTEFKEGCVYAACVKPIFGYHKYTCKTKQLKIMLSPLKSPDKLYPKYSDKSKHQKVVLTSDEKVTALNFLEIQRKSKRKIEINSIKERAFKCLDFTETAASKTLLKFLMYIYTLVPHMVTSFG